MIYAFIIAISIIIFLGVGILQRIYYDKKLENLLKYNYAKIPDKTLTEAQIIALSRYFNLKKPSTYVDDITYDDLDFIEVFKLIDNSLSSIGSEYIYRELRNIQTNEDILLARNNLIEYFQNNEKNRIETQKKLFNIGKVKFSVYEKLVDIVSAKKISLIFEIVMLILMSLSLIMTTYDGRYFIGFIVLVMINITMYLTRFNKYNSYFLTFRVIINIVRFFNKFKFEDYYVNERYRAKVNNINKKLSSMRKLHYLINYDNHDIFSIIYGYINMILHIDIIASNLMLRKTLKNIDIIIEAYELIGEIELAISVASFRELNTNFTKPNFSNKVVFEAEELCHPLLFDGVKNSLYADRAVLITGSNASGKSTFLKTIAINQILAQTIYTVIAKKYYTTFFDIKTSMAIRDKLFSNESYFIVEIKSIKRLIDSSNTDVPLMCFIDEILRGTNTAERIAAAKVILEKLSLSNCLCFAATHDLELTYLLDKTYDNYYFREHITDNDVQFDYVLREGRSNTRNAIALLGIIGFSDDIIKMANEQVKRIEGINETV